MTTVLAVRTAGTAAFESRTAAGTATASIIWSAAAIVGAAIVAAVVVAIASAAAIRPLEPCARIAANARGVAREILARLGRAGARGACLTGKEGAGVFRQ